MTMQAIKSTPSSSTLAHLVEVDGVAIEQAPESRRALRDTFGRLPSGVVAVCAELGEFSSFSRQGLIDQLSISSGSQFSLEEATYAVDKIEL